MLQVLNNYTFAVSAKMFYPLLKLIGDILQQPAPGNELVGNSTH